MDIFAFASSLVPVAGAIGGIASSARVVQENERGMKLRFGRVVRDRSGAPKVIEPGFRLIIPAIDRLAKVHMRFRTINMAPQEIMLKDQTVFTVGAMVIAKVRDTPEDIYNALFATDDLLGSTADYCAAELRDLLATMACTEMTDPAALAREAHTRVTEQLAQWGLYVEVFKLTDCSPTTSTARLLLTTSEAGFRTEALMDNAAKLAASNDVRSLHPSIAAAIIGVPVAVQLTNDRLRMQPTASSVVQDEEYDDED